MGEITKKIPENSYNLSQLTELAVATKEIAEAPISTPNVMLTLVDSSDDTTLVDQYAQKDNISTPILKAGDQYLPINVDLGSLINPAPPVVQSMTEDEKRRRTIIVASVVLLILIVLVSILALKKGKK